MSTETIYDAVTQDMIADVHPEFDSHKIKIRCVNCHQAVETILGKLRMKFPRGMDWLTIRSQRHFRIPFFGFEFTLTTWERTVRYRK